MLETDLDTQFLKKFEQGFNPRYPERSTIPARVLGYGEMSAVLEIAAAPQPGLAYKRMPMFHNETEANDYAALYDRCLRLLRQEARISAVPGQLEQFSSQDGNQIVVYLIQPKLRDGTICNQIMQSLSAGGAARLFLAILREVQKVFDFNRANQGVMELGLDAQLSNWVVNDYDPDTAVLPDPIHLQYLDTSSPLLRRHGQEQIDPDLFLRSAPSFLRWLIRLLFQEEVLERYYDRRQVVVDILANLYKEQRPDLIQPLTGAANGFLARTDGHQPITEGEVRRYYRRDARIWRVYLACRKLDRALHRLVGKTYPYLLPEKVQR